MPMIKPARIGLSAAMIVGVALFAGAALAEGVSVYQATLAEADAKTPEVSTEQMRRIMADRSALILDTRSRAEFVAGHIPGAHSLDASPSAQVAAVERLVSGKKARPWCSTAMARIARPAGVWPNNWWRPGSPMCDGIS